MQDQLHGVTESLERAASMAGTVSGDIKSHLTTLRPTVDALKGEWEGTARPLFDAAHADWEAAVTRLTAALDTLGENTKYAVATYVNADEVGASSLKAVPTGGLPFDGALA